MANHLYARVGNVWASLSDLTSAEMQVLDYNAANSISSDGGVYSLTEALTIGGAPGVGIEFNVQLDAADVVAHGTLTVDDSAFLNGDATFSGTNFSIASPFMSFGDSGADLFTFNAHGTFEATANFNDEVFFNDDATFDGTNLDINSGIVTIGTTGADALTVYSSTTFIANTIFDGDPTFYGQPDFEAQAIFRDQITFLGAGRIVQRQVIGTDADTTFLAVSQSHVHVPAGVLTATRFYKIDVTGAVPGDRVRFSNMDGTYPIVIQTMASGTLAQLNSSTGSRFWCEVELFPGGFLRVSGAGNMP